MRAVKANSYYGATLLLLGLVLVMVGSPAGAAPPIRLTDRVPDPEQPGVRWFAPTGHTLRGAFLDYWTQYGGVAQFGYSLTEEFTEPDGPDHQLLMVQYFER